MKPLIFVVLFVLLGAFFTEAQQSPLRYNSTTFPARIITNNGTEGCPPAEQREAVRNEIKTNVSDVLLTLRTAIPDNVSQYCGGGAWTRIVHINMTDTTQQCPGTFREYTSPVRTCGRRTTSSGSCDSATFSVNSARYSRVCGRVIAYQVGSPSAFWPFLTSRSGATSIDGFYLDGISITHGLPRQHIWSFAASPSETYSGRNDLCPCSSSLVTASNPPSFVGNDYFCETGDPSNCCRHGYFFADDPLFDGHGCGSTSSCCSFNSPPWFSKQLLNATTDNIEVRVCSDEASSNDDVPFQILELYIQ